MTRHILFAPLALLLLCAVRLPAGELTDRMNLTLDRILHGGPPTYDDDFVVADVVTQQVRRFTEFSGDVSGRYLGALACITQVSDKESSELHRVAAKVVKAQKPDGHFGEPFSTGPVTKSDMALLWGNGRLLIGLLEYNALKPTPSVLAAARRLGDCFLKLAPRLNDPAVREKYSGDQMAVGYICWTQIIEGLVELHCVTHDDRYLQLAEQIAANTHRYPKEHSHGFVTALRGILDLYRVTHDEKYLRQVETEWEGILASGNLLPQGALPEIFKPLDKRDEGCAEADWLRLNLGLWTITRQARYLDSAEWTLFNEFFFNEFSTGDFGHHTFSSDGIARGGMRAWWCCTFHGLRAFPAIFRATFHAEPALLCYDLPVDGTGAIPGLAMQANSTLAQDASVSLRISTTDGEEHTLRIRQPPWASALEFQLNLRPFTALEQNGAREIRRRWKNSDELIIHYAMRTRLLPNPQDAKRVAFVYGPWLLGVNEQNSPTFFDEPSELNRIRLPTPDTHGVIQLKPVVEPSAQNAPFVAPAAHLALTYLPGGYPIQPQTVTLRPIAEHTAIADSTPWVFWFRPEVKK